METKPLHCSACGAPLTIPGDVDQIKCDSCGTIMQIQRSESELALKAAKQVSKVIEASHSATQSEIKKLQLTHQISLIELQISSVRGDIRETKITAPGPNTPRLLQELTLQEYDLANQLRPLKLELLRLDGAVPLAVAAAHLDLLHEQETILQRITANSQEKDRLLDELHLLRSDVEAEFGATPPPSGAGTPSQPTLTRQAVPTPSGLGGPMLLKGCALWFGVLFGGSFLSIILVSLLFSGSGETENPLFVPLFFLLAAVWLLLAGRIYLKHAAARLSTGLLKLFVAASTSAIWINLMLVGLGLFSEESTAFLAASLGLFLGAPLIALLAWWAVGRPTNLAGKTIRRLFNF